MAQTKKIMGAVAAIALVLTTVLTFAFQSDKAAVNKLSKHLVPTTWYFIGDELSDATTASSENWTTENPELGCGVGTDVPCALIVEDASNLTDLQLFLNGKTAVQIRDNYASSKRAE